ncbi:MAG TPA: hypothetical protein VJN42_01885 [Candidatus Acidoferrum sp.]|nr:hypothetical protein [Candidatus Acidoferrum sp.]
MRGTRRAIARVLFLPLVLLISRAQALQKLENKIRDDLYGLYYGTWSEQPADVATVISPDGKPIPPKENDPQAPTRPGFYVGEKRFEFVSSRVSNERFTFQTTSVDGVAFSFDGKFGRERVEGIDELVPYVEGELRETRDGTVVKKKTMHFAHAVVL